jgi:hypothetical protein
VVEAPAAADRALPSTAVADRMTGTPREMESMPINNHDLENLYRSTEEDMQFAIGLLALPDCRPAPILQIRYRDWTREKLEVVRESFKVGFIVANGKRKDGKYDLFIGTREQVALQSEEDGHKSALRAPAWDAHLPGVDAPVVRRFEANRRRYGGFLLLVQRLELGFLTRVCNDGGRAAVGNVCARSISVRNGDGQC